MRSLLALVLFAILVSSCASVSITPGAKELHGTSEATGTPLHTTEDLIPAAAPTQTAVFDPTETAQPAVSKPTPACSAQQAVCILDGHFLLQRPIAAKYNNTVDHTYRYGSTQGGIREPHHGVEFPNAQGTPVLAVADGVVAFAGDDKTTMLAWMPSYYGKVVVLEHHLAGLEGSVFSLYGHQFKINVLQGQRVRAGDVIGQVGATGRAIGSHLHFEVRFGANNYRSNRNPELWLEPLAGKGVLAGRIQDGKGSSVSGRINIQRFKNGVLETLSVGTAETYVTNEAQPVRGDDDLEESFVVGDLSAGEYRLTLIYNDRFYEQVIKIEPGRLTFVKFFVK